MSKTWTEIATARCWKRGRYTIECAPVLGELIYHAWFKPSAETPAVCVSEERRKSFEAAEADCAAHYKQSTLSSTTEGEQA